MSKNFFFKLFAGLIFVLGAVLWLLSLIVPQTFGWFNASYAVSITCGSLGLLLIAMGCFANQSNIIKKIKIWLGIGLIVVTVYSLISAILLPENLASPIACIVIGMGLIISILVTGGKKWDEGDNQKIGYKNYHERKKEEQFNDENKDEKIIK